MPHFPARGEIDDFIVQSEVRLLAFDLGEERGQAEIVGLADGLEGVIVTLCALHAHAKEQLRQRLGRLFGRA